MSKDKIDPVPSCILRAYGLDAVLTDEDDPELWRVLLRRYFPAPSGLRLMEPERFPCLTFAVVLWSERMLRQIEVNLSRPRKSDYWRITRLPSGDLVPTKSRHTLLPYSHLELRVPRPTLGLAMTTVQFGARCSVTVGSGNFSTWAKSSDGIWSPTGVEFGHWVS